MRRVRLRERSFERKEETATTFKFRSKEITCFSNAKCNASMRLIKEKGGFATLVA